MKYFIALLAIMALAGTASAQSIDTSGWANTVGNPALSTSVSVSSGSISAATGNGAAYSSSSATSTMTGVVGTVSTSATSGGYGTAASRAWSKARAGRLSSGSFSRFRR